MKLPKPLRPAPRERQALENSSVTISGDALAVSPYRDSLPDGEHRRVLVAAPAGITAAPATGAEVLSAAVAGDTVVLGCLEGAPARSITLAVGTSSITLTADGITLRSGGTVLSVTPDGVKQ